MIIDRLVAELGFDLKDEGDLKRFNSGLDAAEKKAQAVAMRMNAISVAVGTFVGNFATSAFRRLASTIGSLPGDVLSVGREFENLETVLTTIEGSADVARASMDWVQEFATKTPYDLQQVSEAFVRMRAYGLDPMNGLLHRVGDAAAGMGKGLMQGVEAVADAVTGENERLKEFGITSKTEGSKVTYFWNENGKQLSKTVKKNGAEIVAALTEIFGRFDGAMDELSKKQDGILGNLGDQWTDFLKRIGDAGYYDDVTRRLRGVQDLIEKWDRDGILGAAATGISRFLTGSMQFAERVGRVLWDMGKAAYYTAAGITDLISKITGLNTVASAGLLGAAILGSTGTGRAMLAALAKRVPVLAAFLVVEDIMSALRGDDSYITQLEGGQEAIDKLKNSFENLASAVMKLQPSLEALFRTDPSTFINEELLKFLTDMSRLFRELAVVITALQQGDWRLAGSMLMHGTDADGLTKIEAYQDRQGRIGRARAAQGGEPKSAPPLEGVFRWVDANVFGGTLSSGPHRSRFDGYAPEPANADALRAALGNLQGNLAKMNASSAAQAAVNDNSQDNRDQSVNVGAPNVTVNVQQAVEAPAAVGSAVGNAVGAAAVPPARRVTGN